MFSLCVTTTIDLCFCKRFLKISFCFYKLGNIFLFIPFSFYGFSSFLLKLFLMNYKVTSIAASFLQGELESLIFLKSSSLISSSSILLRYQCSGSVTKEKSNLTNSFWLSISILPTSPADDNTSLNAGSTTTRGLLLCPPKTISHVLKALLKGLTITKSTWTSFIRSLAYKHCSIPL